MYVFERTSANQDLAHRRIDLLTPTVYWPVVESSLGIVGACLPLLRPVFTDMSAKSILSSVRALISRSSLRTTSADAPSLDYAKLEAVSVQTPPSHKFEGTEMV